MDIYKKDSVMDIYKIAQFFLNNGCTIFGGYVRDILLVLPPEDLDVFVDSRVSLEKLVWELMDKYPVRKLEVEKGYSYSGRFEHHRFLVGSIQVDMVVGEDNLLPDCDINRFTLSKTVKGSLRLGIRKGDLTKSLQNLYNRRFCPEPGMSSVRRQKMLDKGFVNALEAKT